MKWVRLQKNGEDILVPAMKISGELWFQWEGDTHVYVPASKRKGKAGAEAVQDPSQILAPMPGKILKVFKKQGDAVEEGETLVAMEAMKMEYNLKALKAMKVSQIKCQEGDAVGLGDQLVVLEELS